jgi:DNA-binding FadR family transcriptional regulator
MSSPILPVRRAPSLTTHLVQSLGDRIRDGRWAPGSKLPREADLIDEFQVSRTVVREAISRLQAAGMVETRHGVGSFVMGPGDASAFHVRVEQLATLRDVVDILELRIAVETESAGLAAARRTEEQLAAMGSALEQFREALTGGRSSVGADVQFHLEVARATQNPRFAELMSTLGGSMIPRARLEAAEDLTDERRSYLQGVGREHEQIYRAIERRDAEAARAAMRTHLTNSRERRVQLMN